MSQRFRDRAKVFDEFLTKANMLNETSMLLDCGGKRKVLNHFDLFLIHL